MGEDPLAAERIAEDEEAAIGARVVHKLLRDALIEIRGLRHELSGLRARVESLERASRCTALECLQRQAQSLVDMDDSMFGPFDPSRALVAGDGRYNSPLVSS